MPKEKPKKLDHLYLGPAAGEGLPDRLQCQGCTNSENFASISCILSFIS